MRRTEERNDSVLAEIQFRLLCFLVPSHYNVVLLTQYCAGGKIETNEMGRACSTYGGG